MANDNPSKLDAQIARMMEDVREETVETLRQYRQAQAQISKALASGGAPYVEFMQQLYAVRNQFASWVEENREAIKSFQANVASALQIGAEVAKVIAVASLQFHETLKRTDHIAKLGWTFPSHFYPKDLVHMARLETRQDADEYVLKWYDENDSTLERMEKRICNHPAMARFGTVLPQCFNSIRRGDYSIAIPPLIAVLEHIILLLNPPHVVSSDVKKTLRKGGYVAKDAVGHVVSAAVWLSLSTFVNELYTQLPAELRTASPVLSRHGIQHGRFEAPNERVEAIRVLHAIDTALSLKDRFGLWNTGSRKRPVSTANEAQ